MGLENLRSIFQDEVFDRADEFVSISQINFSAQSPIFDSLTNTNIVDFSTTTNTQPAFPQTYSPLNEIINDEFNKGLGDSFINHGWFDLYLKNHVSKDISEPKPRSQNPFQPFQFGNPNINTNLDIRDDNVRSSLFSPSRNSLIGNTGEPYIVSNLPTDSSQGGRNTNAGNRLFPLPRALTDVDRISKYLASPSGLLNLLAKNAQLIIPTPVVINKNRDGLVRVPQRFNAGFNLLSTISSVGARVLGQGVPNFLMKSGFSGEYGSSSNNLFENSTSALVQGYAPKSIDKINNTFTAASEVDGVGTGGFLSKFGIDSSDVDRNFSGVGDKMTLAPMIKGTHLLPGGGGTMVMKDQTDVEETIQVNIDTEREGMPLYFKDLRDNKYIFFRAYVDGITEDLAPNWSQTDYIGRSEAVYVYQNASRSITFTLKLIANTKQELSKIYEKMNRLTSLCYPEYAKDELISDYMSPKNTQEEIIRQDVKTRMKPPLTKFRLGDMFGTTNNELLGFIESISYSVPSESTYETENKKRVPKHITATITYKVIHGKVPELKDGDSDYKYYGYTGDVENG